MCWKKLKTNFWERRKTNGGKWNERTKSRSESNSTPLTPNSSIAVEWSELEFIRKPVFYSINFCTLNLFNNFSSRKTFFRIRNWSSLRAKIWAMKEKLKGMLTTIRRTDHNRRRLANSVHNNFNLFIWILIIKSLIFNKILVHLCNLKS